MIFCLFINNIFFLFYDDIIYFSFKRNICTTSRNCTGESKQMVVKVIGRNRAFSFEGKCGSLTGGKIFKKITDRFVVIYLL